MTDNNAPMGDETTEEMTDEDVEQFLEEATNDDPKLEQLNDGEGQN